MSTASAEARAQCAARLGIFLGWIFTSIAVLLAAAGVWVFSKLPASPRTDAQFYFFCAIFGAGAIVWVGRGIRFVLRGRQPDPNIYREFVEKFADPKVPIRKPPQGPWGPKA
jgi:hypothetical protein